MHLRLLPRRDRYNEGSGLATFLLAATRAGICMPVLPSFHGNEMTLAGTNYERGRSHCNETCRAIQLLNSRGSSLLRSIRRLADDEKSGRSTTSFDRAIRGRRGKLDFRQHRVVRHLPSWEATSVIRYRHEPSLRIVLDPTAPKHRSNPRQATQLRGPDAYSLTRLYSVTCLATLHPKRRPCE